MPGKTVLPFIGAICLFATVSWAQAPYPSQNVVTACARTAGGTGPGLHVEVQDEYGPYSAGETVIVSDTSGRAIVTLNCDGPWVNFQLAPGSYRVMAFIGNQLSSEVAVDVPISGASVMLKLQPPPVPPLEPEVAEDGTIRLPPPPSETAENLGSENSPSPAP